MLETQRDSFLSLSLFERKILKWYRRFFSIQEIEQQPILQWAFGALLLAFFTTFYGWANSTAISHSTAMAGRASCWPYFQHCDRLYFLEALPYYSQTTLYAFFFGIMLLVIYFIWQQQWVYVHMAMMVLYLWKVFVMFAVSATLAANYDYFSIVIGTILLFFPYKEVFAKIAFVVLYFFAGTVKIHEGWITASYFTTLIGGMPWFNSTFAPFMTNIVIVGEIVGAWFLLSRRPYFQHIALSFFIFFHLYSIILVAYRYPSTAFTILLVLFGPMYRYTPPVFNRRAIFGWLFIILLFFFQFLPKMVYGDQKWTLEANQYGLNMFEANHQCRSRIIYELDNGKQATSTYESTKAWDRCDPYKVWLTIQRHCDYAGVHTARWTFDHSINGHPFYRIVDVPDACVLTYKPLSHNSWIHIPGEGARVIGRPLKNPYNL